MFNVLKKHLRKEFGQKKYDQYAKVIRRNIKKMPMDTSEIFNDLYVSLKEKDRAALLQMQERMNSCLLDAFQINHQYLWAFVAYLAAFVIIASYAVEVVAIPGLMFISLLFLIKTWEYLVNKFCYVDAHLVLVLKSVLEKVMKERRLQ